MKKILLIVFTFFTYLAFGQEQIQEQEEQEVTVCTQNLRQARTLYEEGKLNEIPATLNSCLRSGFTPEERIEAYRLIAITYLYLDEPAKADEAMLKLLQTNPEYSVNENLDPAEYINLYRSFRTKWLFRWGIKGGVNYSIPHVTEAFPVTEPGIYYGKMGYSFGGYVELDNLLPLIKLQPEITYSSKVYSFEGLLGSPESDDNPGNIGQQTYTGHYNYIEFSITGKYQMWDNKNHYVSLAPGIGYLLSAEYNNIELNLEELTKIDLSNTAYNRINPQLFIGAGTEIKFGRFYGIADIRYGYSFLGLIKDDFRYVNEEYEDLPENVYKIPFISKSDHRIHSVILTIGLMRAVYKPKKLNN